MLVNKKAQGMVIDLVLLILISSIFFLFLSSQTGEQSINAGIIRSQSAYTQKLLISTLSYQSNSTGNENQTVAELIGMRYCGMDSTKDEINETVSYAMQYLNKKDHNFIFKYGDTENWAVFNNVSCVKTEKINIAHFEMDLPCNKKIDISLGIWPKTMKVEPC